MIIETKYNIGDEVWINFDGFATKHKVTGVSVHIGRWGHLIREHIWYRMEDDHLYEEEILFPTKEDLLKSL